MRLAQRGCPTISLRLAMALQPSSHGTIAIETVGAQSSNDLSFSVKIQPKSVFEILVLAMPPPPQCATQGHNCGRLSGFGSAQLSPNGEALISRALANHHPA